MSYDRTTHSRSRRPLYAPPPSPPSRHQHSVLGYWVPLITVSTIALGGLAAWIWSERSNDDDEFLEGKPPRPSSSPPRPYPGPEPYAGPAGSSFQGSVQAAGPQGGTSAGGEASSYFTADSASREQGQEDSSWLGQVRGAMRRTPSPQQFFDSASKQLGGAVAAAGAALGSIMEEEKPDTTRKANKIAATRERREDREGFSDHERWSEEAEEKLKLGGGPVEVETAKRAEMALKRDDKTKTKKTVALVVSGDVDVGFEEDGESFNTEHTVSPVNHELNDIELTYSSISPSCHTCQLSSRLPRTSTFSSTLRT